LIHLKVHNHMQWKLFLCKKIAFKFHQLLVWLQKTLMTRFIQWFESFQKVFTTVDQTTRTYIFQAFTSFHLAHYNCPERHFHNEITEIDISILFSSHTGLPYFDSSSNPCAANWFPCFKETRLDPLQPVRRKFEFSC